MPGCPILGGFSFVKESALKKHINYEDYLNINMAKRTTKSSTKESRLQNVQLFLKAVSDSKRLNILIFAKDDFKSVTEIYQYLGIAQNLTSHHILQLKKTGLLIEKPEGIFRRYKTNEKQLNEFLKDFANILALKKK